MEALLIISGVIIMIIIVKKTWSGMKKNTAAMNALVAKYIFEQMDENSKVEVQENICMILQRDWGFSFEQATKDIMSMNEIEFFGFAALAMSEMGINPNSKVWRWQVVPNPYAALVVGRERAISIAQSGLRNQGIEVNLDSTRRPLCVALSVQVNQEKQMGLLSNLFGGGKPSKIDMIKNLAKERIRNDPLAESMGFSESTIDSIGTMELMGIPEAAIVTIVEVYALLLKIGEPEEAIFNQIENHRSPLGTGSMPVPLNLETYIKYRIAIEHGGHGAPISKLFISKAISFAREQYGC